MPTALAHYGDVWTFIALDADTKLIPSFTLANAMPTMLRAFMEDLAGRLSTPCSTSSDALQAYPEAVERGFGNEVDYGQLVKTYSVTHLGKTLWQGDVEVFDLTGHPTAKRCYGWTYGEPEEFITILELPPVTDAQSAVKVGVAYQIKKQRK